MLPLFDSTPLASPVQRVNQERDQAIQRAADRAEQARQGFVAEAQAFVLAYLEQHGPTSGEALTLACKAAGIRPPDDRAFGAVIQGLCRQDAIEKCGSVARMRGHRSAGGNIWARSRAR